MAEKVKGMKKILASDLFFLAVVVLGLLCVVVSFPVGGLAAFVYSLVAWFASTMAILVVKDILETLED